MYDNLLSEDVLEKYKLTKPSFDDYNQCVNNIPDKWRTNPKYKFFIELDSKTRNKEFENLDIRLRQQYIKMYANKRFDINYLSNEFTEQQKKTFILYQNNNFVIEKLNGNPNELRFIENGPFTLRFTDGINNYGYRLCWKNNYGVLGPCWKFCVGKL